MNFKKQQIITIYFLIFSVVLFSQQRRYNQNYGGQQNYQRNTPSTPKKLSIQNMAGILMYDYDEVIKKVKIKDESKKLVVEKAITKYNNKINEIKTFNSDVFSKVKRFIEQKTESAKTSNVNDFKEARLKIRELLKPVEDKVDNQQKILNESLEKILSEKQNSKWLRYENIKIKELRPSYKANNNSSKNHKGKGRKSL
jgi:vacuolar-type H+-ATPase subunit H